MAHTMQEALANAGLVDGKRVEKAAKTLSPEPSATSRRHGLPKWLTRGGILTGPVSDFINPLHSDTCRVWLINEHARTYTQVLDIVARDRFADVLLEGEDTPRTFRMEAKVRYVLTKKESK